MKMLTSALGSPPSGHYLTWGVIHISLTNALIILAMLLVFALALILPFPGHLDDEHGTTQGGAE